METDAGLDERISAVRHFSRFYTRKIGLLQKRFLGSALSLTEGRVLYELAQREKPVAAEIGRDLGLDAGYLSRILSGFERRGLVRRAASEVDGRQSLLSLTPEGRTAFSELDRSSQKEVAEMLSRLPAAAQIRLTGAMKAVEGLLSDRQKGEPGYVLRSFQPGDMGWIVHRQGALYAQEYGYNAEFEALTAEIVAQFIREYDARRERCWIAEKDGAIVGSVFVVRKSKSVAKLRLLYVEPEARGLGIGRRLVEECIRFARQARYGTLTLWTQSELLAARHVYEAAGFRLVGKKKHRSFGRKLTAETWELEL